MKRFIRITGLVLFLVAGFCLAQVPTILAGERSPDTAQALAPPLPSQLLMDTGIGAAHLAEAAVAFGRLYNAGAIRNAVGFLLVLGLLGFAAVVAAHKLDRRVYVAADVEHVLGCRPLAELPDFEEVSEGVAGELVMRLAAGIEYASREAGLRTCVFTGTGAGTGVTTVSGRVKEMLRAMGRSAVLVRAAAAPRAVAEAGELRVEPKEQAGSPATALLQNAIAENDRLRENLILTDTAPLTLSAETEDLARSCDGAIVVIESGVTTRAELRATADRLQQLNVATVGFVLNRIGRSKADPAFRRSVKETERHLRCQNGARVRKPLWSLVFALEPEGSALSRLEPAWLQASTSEAGLRSISASRVFAGSEMLPPVVPPRDRFDRRVALGDLQILPSRRGQYRRAD
jgi:hypothetical protein